MLVATKLWAMAHLLTNGAWADVVLFGAIIAWAGMDRVSMKRRAPAGLPRARSSKWNDPLVLALGFGLYALMLGGAHLRLIGVPVGTPWG